MNKAQESANVLARVLPYHDVRDVRDEHDVPLGMQLELLLEEMVAYVIYAYYHRIHIMS